MTNQPNPYPTPINFITISIDQLAQLTSPEYANMMLDDARRIADYAALDDEQNRLDPTDPDNFIIIDDMIQQLIEPCAINAIDFDDFTPPLPTAIPDELQTIIPDLILRSLIHYFIFHPDTPS